MTKITQLPYKLGITGTRGAGKSLVGKILAHHRVTVLDTDAVVRALWRDDKAMCRDAREHFGDAIFFADGAINPVALNEIIFADTTQKQWLNDLVHPRVGEAVAEFFAKVERERQPICAVLVPLLFEAKVEARFDEIWAIMTKADILLARLMAREKIPLATAEQRLAGQWSQEAKAARADYVIDNSASPDETERQVERLLKPIQQRLQEKGS